MSRNKKCRKCKKPLEWIEGLLDNDGNRCLEFGRYYCKSCKLSLKSTESIMVKEGRSMAQEYENEDVLGKKMLSLHPMLQLGILRELQK